MAKLGVNAMVGLWARGVELCLRAEAEHGTHCPIHDAVLGFEHCMVGASWTRRRANCLLTQRLPKRFERLRALEALRHPDGTPVYRVEETKPLLGSRAPRMGAAQTTEVERGGRPFKPLPGNFHCSRACRAPERHLVSCKKTSCSTCHAKKTSCSTCHAKPCKKQAVPRVMQKPCKKQAVPHVAKTMQKPCKMRRVRSANPPNPHSPRVPCYMCMCYMALYSTYTTDFRAYRIYSTFWQGAGGVDVQRLGAASMPGRWRGHPECLNMSTRHVEAIRLRCRAGVEASMPGRWRCRGGFYAGKSRNRNVNTSSTSGTCLELVPLVLNLEGVSQMVYILPERLLALVRPAFDLVLRRIRSLKRCVQACGCKIETPRYAQQFGSRLHFKRCQALPKETPFPFFSGTPFFGTPCFLFFLFFLSPQRLARLKCNLEPNCCAYLGVFILPPARSVLDFESFAGQGQMLDGRVLGAFR